MRKNRVVILFISLIVAIIVISLVSNRYSTLKEGETDFAVSDTAAVTKIFIADKKDNSVLLKKEAAQWTINNQFVANTAVVDFLLSTMNRLKVKSPVPLSVRNGVISRLASNGIKVEVYQEVYRINLFDKYKFFKHEKLTKVFYVGDATQDNMGTYMLIEDAENPYIVFIPGFRGFLYSRFSPKPDDWKSHVVFNTKLADIKSVSLQFFEEPENSFKVDVVDARGNYKVTALQSGEILESYDTLRLLNYLTSFRDLRYETRMNPLLTPMKLDSIVNSTPIYKLTLIDRFDDTIKVPMFKKHSMPESIANAYEVLVPIDHDRFYALINEGNDFVLMQYYVFDRVLYPLSHYRN
ncbi:MAG: DUF4340 domain-containing protein [Bacteroidales bacterium]|jgi:hypothetical protein|nr:DUF4340 domain-containing protein [Bacteroidales bacterium]